MRRSEPSRREIHGRLVKLVGDLQAGVKSQPGLKIEWMGDPAQFYGGLLEPRRLPLPGPGLPPTLCIEAPARCLALPLAMFDLFADRKTCVNKNPFIEEREYLERLYRIEAWINRHLADAYTIQLDRLKLERMDRVPRSIF